MLFPLLLIPGTGEWRGVSLRKVVQTQCVPLRRFLFARAHTHTHSQRPCAPLAPYGSIFSQRFPFSFCRARAPLPPFVITPRLKIPYVAAAAYPFLLLPYIYIIICQCVRERECVGFAFIVCAYVCVSVSTHIYVIYFQRLSLSLFLSERGYRANSLRYRIFFEYFHLPSLCSSACLSLCAYVRTDAYMRVCVSTYRFFPLICIYVYSMFIYYYIACTGCCCC